MSSSLQILADHEALTLTEKAKRRDQSIHRPRVHEKYKNILQTCLTATSVLFLD